MRLLKLLTLLSLIICCLHSCKDACDDIDCGQNGICVDGTCECDPGYSGVNCQITPCDSVDCGANGTCNEADGTCDCNEGYSGENCEINVCDTVDCGENGSCDTTTGACICNDGYEGANCDTEIREKHFGTYIGNLLDCVPAIIAGFPGVDLSSLEMTPLEVFASDNGAQFIDIGSMSEVLELNVTADVTKSDFEVPAFEQEVDVQGLVVIISGSGTGMIIDENNISLSLDLVFDLGAAMTTSTCSATFTKS